MRRSITHCPVPNTPESWSGLTHETEPRKYFPSSLTLAPMRYCLLSKSPDEFFMMIDIVLVFLAIVVSAHAE